MSDSPDHTFRPARPRDERDELNLKRPDAPAPQVHERRTIRADESSMQLERIGLAHEGSDGKRYLGSVAMHIYEIPRLMGMKEHVFNFHSTDITQIPETIMAQGLPELGRALMRRYGREAPRSTLDKYTAESDEKRS